MQRKITLVGAAFMAVLLIGFASNAMATTTTWYAPYSAGFWGTNVSGSNTGCYSDSYYTYGQISTGYNQVGGSVTTYTGQCLNGPAYGGVGIQPYGGQGDGQVSGLVVTSNSAFEAALDKVIAENQANATATLTKMEQNVAVEAGYPANYFASSNTNSLGSANVKFVGSAPISISPQTSSVVSLSTDMYFYGTDSASTISTIYTSAAAQYNIVPEVVVFDDTALTVSYYTLSGAPSTFYCNLGDNGNCSNGYNSGYTLTASFSVNTAHSYTIEVGVFMTLAAAQVGGYATASAVFCPSSDGSPCASSYYMEVQYIQLSY